MDQRLDLFRARRLEPNALHRLAEPLAVLGFVDGLGGGADHGDVEALEHAHLVERQRRVERGLPAHGGKEPEPAGSDVTLLLDDLGDDLGRDRLDISRMREIGIGHDRRRIRVHQHDSIAFGLERLDRLRPRIIELTGLADDDRPRADDEDRGDVGPLGHVARRSMCAGHKKRARSLRVLRAAQRSSPRAGRCLDQNRRVGKGSAGFSSSFRPSLHRGSAGMSS